MRKILIALAASTAMASLAAPTLAQTTPSAGAGAGASTAAGSTAAWKSGQKVKVGDVIGTAVYDSQGQKIGEISAVAVNPSDNVTHAVIDLGDGQQASMPWDRLSAREGNTLTADADKKQMSADMKQSKERSEAYKNRSGEDVVNWPQGQAKAQR